ncbi:hypothetical protein Tco_0152348 [Tanacetum coccineum]
MPIELGSFDAIIGMDWLAKYRAVIVYAEKIVRIPWKNKTLIIHGDGSHQGNVTRLNIISCTKTQKYKERGFPNFLAHVTAKDMVYDDGGVAAGGGVGGRRGVRIRDRSDGESFGLRRKNPPEKFSGGGGGRWLPDMGGRECLYNVSPKPVLLSLQHAQLPVPGSTRMYRDLRLPTSGPK